ncbi:hypothetical protein ScPMuIL_009417 [Solemya velum]
METSEQSRKSTVSLKDESDGTVLTLSGFRDVFIVGLAADGKLCSIQDFSKNNGRICVPLFKISICNPQGFTIRPVSTDLQCKVNHIELTGEVNLLTDSLIQVADKFLIFVDGPVPKRRRKLPHTPGSPLGQPPPEKPARAKPAPTLPNAELAKAKKEDEKEISSDWCIVSTPAMEKDYIDYIETADQLGIVCASHFTKQVSLYTDMTLDSKTMDQVFRIFRDVAVHNGQVLRTYFKETTEITKTDNRIDYSNHRPAVHLLTELLKQFLDPVEYVILSLQLLRTYSHFCENLLPMITCRAPAAVLGSMTVYIDVTEVQQFSLDILAKIANYKPKILEKTPLHETAVEMVVRAMRHHKKQLDIARSGCRTLANLSTTLFELSNNIIDTEKLSEDGGHYLERCLQILDFLHRFALSDLQEAMKLYDGDLGIKMEGRRFLHILARMPQLQQKKKLWLNPRESQAVDDELEVSRGDNQSPSSFSTAHDSLEVNLDSDSLLLRNKFLEVIIEEEPVGILKRVPVFVERHSPVHRVKFVDQNDSTADSSTDEETERTRVESHIEAVKIESVEELSFESQELIKSLDTNPEMDDSVDAVDMRNDEAEDTKSGVNLEDMLESLDSLDAYKTRHTINYSTSLNPGKGAETLSIPGVSDSVVNKSYACRTSELQSSDVQNRKFKFEELTDSSDRIHSASPDILSESLVDASGPSQSDMSPDLIPVEPSSPKSAEFIFVTEDRSQVFNSHDSQEEKSFSPLEENLPKQNRSVKEGANPFESSSISVDTQHKPDHMPSANEINVETPSIVSASPSSHIVEGKKDKPERIHSAVDEEYMARVLRTQVIYHVTRLVHSGRDTHALQIIDLPMIQLLEDSTAPSGLVKFAKLQYTSKQSLMDVDAALLINIIDAVRYRHLLRELLQASVRKLIDKLASKHSDAIVTVAMELITKIFEDQAIREFLSDSNFLTIFKVSLDEASGRLHQNAELQQLNNHIASVLNFPV